MAGDSILYIPSNVEAEVEEKFERIARFAGVPVEAVRSAWRDHYSRYVRVIDGVPAEHDRRWLELAADDPDDLPFAEAVAMIGPILALSEDTHLTGRGLANNRWRDVPDLHGRMRAVDYTLGAPPVITIALVDQAIRAARRYPEIAIVVALVLAFLFSPIGPERLRLTNERVRAIGGAIGKAFVQLMIMRAEASAQLTARLTHGSADETLGAVVAALLQECEPIAFHTLSVRLSGQLSEDELAKILHDWPMFVEVWVEHWQLGRSI